MQMQIQNGKQNELWQLDQFYGWKIYSNLWPINYQRYKVFIMKNAVAIELHVDISREENEWKHTEKTVKTWKKASGVDILFLFFWWYVSERSIFN